VAVEQHAVGPLEDRGLVGGEPGVAGLGQAAVGQDGAVGVRQEVHPLAPAEVEEDLLELGFGRIAVRELLRLVDLHPPEQHQRPPDLRPVLGVAHAHHRERGRLGVEPRLPTRARSSRGAPRPGGAPAGD